MILYKNAPRQEYRLKNGTLVPGVTTVLEIMNKPALGKWMWQCGKDGVPWPIPKEATAGVGTIAHYKIHTFLSWQGTGMVEEYGPGWEPEHIKTAETPFHKFCEYYTSRGGRTLLSEYSMVHETHSYGGTMDLLVETREGIELWDIKTSKAIYEENYIQLAAYKMLLDQDSKYRHMKIKPRVVLCTKDGQLSAPSVSKSYITKARNTWGYLIKTYHKLQEFRKAA